MKVSPFTMYVLYAAFLFLPSICISKFGYAHIASVLQYLGFEWHQPATKLSKAHDKYIDPLTGAEAGGWKSIME